MSYRCQLCSKIVPRGVSLRRHVTYRPRLDHWGEPTGHTEIASETPVCLACQQLIANGFTLSQVAAKVRSTRYLESLSQAAKESQPVKQSPPPVAPPTYVEPAVITGTSDPIDF